MPAYDLIDRLDLPLEVAASILAEVVGVRNGTRA